MPISEREISAMIIGSIRFISRKINSKSALFYKVYKTTKNQLLICLGKQDEEKKCVCKNIAAGFCMARVYYSFI